MGEFYSLLTAMIWAVAVILIKKTGEAVSPFALNLFRVSVSSALLILTLWAQGGDLFRVAPPRDYLLLCLSGVVAIALSDTLFHLSLNVVGAGVSAIVDSLYSPFTVLAAFLFLGERIGAPQLAGMCLVLLGVIAAAHQAPRPGTSSGRLWAGAAWGVLAMLSLAAGIVIAKPVLDRSPVIWATAVRQVGSLAVMLPISLASRRRRRLFEVFLPSQVWKTAVPGAVLGSYLALMFWIAGMKYTQAGVAAILNQSCTVYILVLAAVFLKEPFTRRKCAACALALSGILLVTFG